MAQSAIPHAPAASESAGFSKLPRASGLPAVVLSIAAHGILALVGAGIADAQAAVRPQATTLVIEADYAPVAEPEAAPEPIPPPEHPPAKTAPAVVSKPKPQHAQEPAAEQAQVGSEEVIEDAPMLAAMAVAEGGADWSAASGIDLVPARSRAKVEGIAGDPGATASMPASSRRSSVDLKKLERAWVAEANRAVRQQAQVEYSKQARRRRLQGVVVLNIWVNDAGTIEEVTVAQASGHDSLVAGAVRAVQALASLPAPPDALRWERRRKPLVITIDYRLRR